MDIMDSAKELKIIQTVLSSRLSENQKIYAIQSLLLGWLDEKQVKKYIEESEILCQ